MGFRVEGYRGRGASSKQTASGLLGLWSVRFRRFWALLWGRFFGAFGLEGVRLQGFRTSGLLDVRVLSLEGFSV